MKIAVWCPILLILGTAGGAVLDTGNVAEQGLYRTSDGVTVLTNSNFDRAIYGRPHVWLLQFYNSFCGHCRSFAPKFKTIAADASYWKPIIKLATIDCSVEENNDICRQFEVMAYPSLRYLHENYIKSNSNIGDRIDINLDTDKLKRELVDKMLSEQSMGHLRRLAPLSIAAYASYASALSDVPRDVIYTFLVFEDATSLTGPELILDTNDYEKVRVKRVLNISELTVVANVQHFPGLLAVKSNLEVTHLTPKNPNRESLLNAINTFLKSKNYAFPARDDIEKPNENLPSDRRPLVDTDVVYYSDLEKTIKTTLHTEIVKYKILKGEPLLALINYLDVLIKSFPFKVNGQAYMMSLRNAVITQSEWSGNELFELVKRLEHIHAPVYSSNLEYIACRGSQPKYRGYTCGLWTLFHTLTVNARNAPGVEGPNVLKAMLGYVKHFFGCTECSTHFQAMAVNNHMMDVNDNERAILWLWIAHNEVNLRLAGDVTEDPLHPKIQFPKVEHCKSCRLARGAWNLPAVSQYVKLVYGATNLQEAPQSRTSAAPSSSISRVDLAVLSLLYISSFIMLILVAKLFISRRFNRKRIYKRDAWGKV